MIVTLDPVLKACWTKVGEQRRIPFLANQQKQHCHVFGAYNWASDQLSWTKAEQKNSGTFIAFLEHLLVDEYPTGCIVLVLDHAPYHRSAAAQAALSLFEHRVLVFWLPAYCTELKPIEHFWRYLKDLARANQLWSDIDRMVGAAETMLHHQNDPFHESRFILSNIL